MKNINELRTELTKLYGDVKSKRIKLPEAKALVNTANSIIKTVKTELDHNKFVGIKDQIDFISGAKKKK